MSQKAAASRPSFRASSFASRLAGRARATHPPFAPVDRLRLRRRARARHRQGRPSRRARARADARRRLRVLQRGLLSRLPVQALACRRQELRRERGLRSLDGHRRRDPRSAQARAHDPPERRAGPACVRRGADLRHSPSHRLPFRRDGARAGRRHRHRHAGRRRLRAHAAVVAEGGRRRRGRDLADRRAAQSRRSRMDCPCRKRSDQGSTCIARSKAGPSGRRTGTCTTSRRSASTATTTSMRSIAATIPW